MTGGIGESFGQTGEIPGTESVAAGPRKHSSTGSVGVGAVCSEKLYALFMSHARE